MTTSSTPIDEKLEQHILKHSQFDNSDLNFVLESTQQFHEPNMQISKIQATTLQFFIQAFRIKHIVEIGTFVGYSTFVMQKAASGMLIKNITPPIYGALNTCTRLFAN